MKSRLCGLSGLLAFSAFACHTQAALPTREARLRATFYQAEVRAVLIQRKWQISSDEAGRLVAVHLLGPTGANSGALIGGPTMAGAARLTFTFQPKTSSDTECTANIVAYIKPDRRGKKLIGPLPFANEDSKKEVKEALVQASKQLAAKHPEYTAK